MLDLAIVLFAVGIALIVVALAREDAERGRWQTPRRYWEP